MDNFSDSKALGGSVGATASKFMISPGMNDGRSELYSGRSEIRYIPANCLIMMGVKQMFPGRFRCGCHGRGRFKLHIS
ncbi:MAG: hypothetical protein LBJ47_06015 [Tannerella sp.]|jgi:hypothetical protein|nr:hypothetical protein [Tannerella sp.]